ncbi:zinc finger CCCH domain-containing protein 66-like [Brassica napus]|uniref:zinc finger CCCH domain-containing protein 66-like n=1 Tax=Brassica napus TaxID=3708 RepID=UPI002078B615|nr:zinc finger CCCH domain-containing protein 66-like [Brassica napus]XP_048598933.1 zinc finger CCCH domain-containing protein 66-like [Brassica napus]XP_048598934.1 zinc finger CCCH domain-containing protein 66-like [Brassica napus]XP_048598935.1 zinc finger CCCH domain-containing protein 66-like [Brassica napus]
MGDDELSHLKFTLLLESAACNDLSGFKSLIEEEGLSTIDRSGLWYGRRLGSKKMGFEERTPLMIAALFGSKEIVDYIISTGLVDVNRSCGSDGATALHCAVSGLSGNSLEVVTLLLNASADPESRDADGNKPVDVMVFPCLSPVFSGRKKVLERLLNGNEADVQEEEAEVEVEVEVLLSPPRKEYPIDPTLPDIKNGIYGTDEFRMYAFKIKPCSRAYSHDWTECPFVHPGENARRRDPRKYHYSCVPCPEFRKGSCSRGDSCEYAHGIFECWLHPAQYRTRLCKDETNCSRRVCFFAHKPDELRPLYTSTGSGVPSPRSSFSSCNDMGPISPLPPLSPNGGMLTTPPLSPNGIPSPIGSGKPWMNWPSATPPTLHLPGSRLKSALNAREFNFSEEIHQSLASPGRWNNNNTAASPPFSGNGMNRLSSGGISPVHSLSDMFGASSLSSSPVGANYQFSMDSLASRAAAFANQRSQSFIESSNELNQHRPAVTTACLDDWGSLDGKLDWSVNGDELQDLRNSTSFRLRAGSMESRTPTELEEPDVSWVEPLVKEPQETRVAPVWMEQSYMETEQTVA